MSISGINVDLDIDVTLASPITYLLGVIIAFVLGLFIA